MSPPHVAHVLKISRSDWSGRPCERAYMRPNSKLHLPRSRFSIIRPMVLCAQHSKFPNLIHLEHFKYLKPQWHTSFDSMASTMAQVAIWRALCPHPDPSRSRSEFRVIDLNIREWLNSTFFLSPVETSDGGSSPSCLKCLRLDHDPTEPEIWPSIKNTWPNPIRGR